MCVCYACEISPTLIIVPAFIQQKKQKWNNKGFIDLNTGEPKTYYYYFNYISIIIY